MNETIFLFHIAFVTFLTLVALRLGKMGLSAWICLQAILANLFVTKQIKLFSLDVTASDVFFIGSVLGLNLMQEHFDKNSVQKTTKNCFYLMAFFAICSQIHLLYIPSSYDRSQEAFNTLLKPAPRLLLASLVTFFLVQKVDVFSFNFLKKKMGKAPFSIRNFLTLLLSQFIDTILFSMLGLYGLVGSLTDVIVASFIIKLFVIFSLSPLVHLSKKWIQPKEFAS